jgi:hypothetical protein
MRSILSRCVSFRCGKYPETVLAALAEKKGP